MNDPHYIVADTRMHLVPTTEGRDDYSGILTEWNIKATMHPPYLQVGTITGVQGWTLYISSIEPELEEVLRELVPVLLVHNVPFKMIMDRSSASSLLQGSLGYPNIGKLICIYPRTERSARTLATVLLAFTVGRKGPAIPSSASLGNTLYARYGSFGTTTFLDEDGSYQPLMRSESGDLVIDHQDMPFKIPKGIAWPFSHITSFKKQTSKKWLRGRYLQVTMMKSDAKGQVAKAIDFKRPLSPNWCLIKEGKKWMYADRQGRDMKDRLIWQAELHDLLKDSVPMPRLLDKFEWDDNYFLVFEYIEGVTLKDKIAQLNQGQYWSDLSLHARILILNLLLEVISILKSLHARNIVHRDFTSANFMIDERNRLFLIDLELAYSISQHHPSPPFKLGTAGFISPEQLACIKPTFKEDIYALGANLVFFFTGLEPLVFGPNLSTSLAKNLSYHLADRGLVELIMDCLHDDPDERPSLPDIERAIVQHKASLINSLHTHQQAPPSPDPQQIRDLIQKCIKTLGSDIFLHRDPDGRIQTWPSKLIARNTSADSSFSFYGGFREGASGMIYLLHSLQSAGFDIDACRPGLAASYDFIFSHYINNLPNIPAGLFGGGGGLAIALTSILTYEPTYKPALTYNALAYCLELPATSLSLAHGTAGQLLAALFAHSVHPTDEMKHTISTHIDRLVQDKRSNPSVQSSFGSGTAGILFSLLSCRDHFPDAIPASMISKSLEALSRQSKSQFPKASCVTEGRAGLALIYLKAYEQLKNPEYRSIAQSLLMTLPPRPISSDLTWTTGLCGLGEVYLYAFQLLKESPWQQRADHIAHLILHLAIETKEGSTYWLMNNNSFPTADLLVGNGAVLHFLMNWLNPHQKTWYNPTPKPKPPNP